LKTNKLKLLYIYNSNQQKKSRAFETSIDNSLITVLFNHFPGAGHEKDKSSLPTVIATVTGDYEGYNFDGYNYDGIFLTE
jgi:hypothetical protein